MKRFLTAAILALATIPAAKAADFPIKAAPAAVARSVYDWTGLYLGINAGYGNNSNCWDMNGLLVLGFNPAVAEGCNGASGAVVGGQVGYRHQLSGTSWVFGIEAMGDWADLTGSNQSSAPGGVANALKLTIPATVSIGLTNSTKTNAIGLFTGQVGYAFFGNVLWFVEGGAAVTNNKYDGVLTASTPGFSLGAADHANEVKFGGAIGTGVDVQFAPGWSAGVKYDHLFMGSQNVGLGLTSAGVAPGALPAAPLLAPGMPTRNESISSDIDLVTVRLNYSFRP